MNNVGTLRSDIGAMNSTRRMTIVMKNIYRMRATEKKNEISTWPSGTPPRGERIDTGGEVAPFAGRPHVIERSDAKTAGEQYGVGHYGLLLQHRALNLMRLYPCPRIVR